MADFSARGENFSAFVSKETILLLRNELAQTHNHFLNTIHTDSEKFLGGLWIGLFDQLTDDKNILTTYFSTSSSNSDEDKDWECKAELNENSYFELPLLTAAYKLADHTASASATSVSIFLPIAFLASLAHQLNANPDAPNFAEYSFGWDSGDSIRWRPTQI